MYGALTACIGRAVWRKAFSNGRSCWTTCGYANSRTANLWTGRLADWTSRGLVNSRTGQVADWTTRGCHQRLCVLSFRFFGHSQDRELCSPQLVQSASCLVRELANPRVVQLPQPTLTPRLYDWCVSSEHLGFIFRFFISLFCLVPCGRLS